MTRRLPHFLTTARGDTVPRRLVCVECDARDVPIPDHPAHVREQLVCWAGAGWDTTSRGARRDWTGGGETAADWWRATLWAARHGGQTWIVSYMAARVWGLLGVWGLIERGELVIVGRDGRDDKGGHTATGVRQVQAPGADRAGTGHGPVGDAVRVLPDTGGRGRRHGHGPDNARRGGTGYCVLEDPPSVLFGRAAGQTGTLILVDVRNWGVDGPPAGLPCADRARWLADVMSRVCALLKRESLGSLQSTAGSQAMYSLRRAHLTHPMHCHTNADALQLERAAYYGGRCECRRIGRLPGPVYHLDYRSLYGSICATEALPALFVAGGDVPPATVPDVLDGATLWGAQVTIETDEPAYPYRRDGLTVYPTGRFVTTLMGPELDDAVRTGRVRTWHSWACYVGTPCLASFARHLLYCLEGARREGDVPLCQFIKRLLVSIVGKLGQRDWRWVPAPHLTHSDTWCAWCEIGADRVPRRARSIGWQCQIEERGEWAPNAIPAVAAWVCSEGRMALLRAIRTAGWEEVYYHDTDSLIVGEAGYRALVSAGQVADGVPGRLRLLGRHDSADVRGIKDYTLDGVSKRSGAPRGTVQQGSDESLYWFREWLKGAVQRGRRPEAKRELRTWSRVGAYRHGRVMADGRVIPWHVG